MQSTALVRPSTLYIVATPIGHLDDIGQRAITVLSSVDGICCEDTRHSRRLMDHIDVSTPLTSLHEHNETEKSAAIVDRLRNGESLALISDAGTPLISDPGYVLVNTVVSAGFDVVPIPGASAVIAALSVSGLPTDRWTFEGFLPSKGSARRSKLEDCVAQPNTLIFYESSHRILDSLNDMAEVFGSERRVAVARELTKTYETIMRGALSDVCSQVAHDHNQQKGEFVVLVHGAPKREVAMTEPHIEALAKELKPLLPPKKAAKAMANAFGGSNKHYYDLLLSLD